MRVWDIMLGKKPEPPPAPPPEKVEWEPSVADHWRKLYERKMIWNHLVIEIKESTEQARQTRAARRLAGDVRS